MIKQTKLILSLVFIITLVSIVIWQLTGGDYYIKFQVVEEIEQPVDPNDPLAVAGFYDNQAPKETVVRNEFRLGLLPTPNSIFDKHLIAVITIVSPAWIIAFGLLWWRRRQHYRVTHAQRSHSSV